METVLLFHTLSNITVVATTPMEARIALLQTSLKSQTFKQKLLRLPPLITPSWTSSIALSL